MLTKAEIIERAALKIDLSAMNAEQLEKLNEMFNGDYAGQMAETDAAIERGVDLFLSAVGRPVDVWYNGNKKTKTVTGISYDKENDYYVLEFDDKGRFMFRNGGFSSFGGNGGYFGIYDPKQGKNGVQFIDYKPTGE